MRSERQCTPQRALASCRSSVRSTRELHRDCEALHISGPPFRGCLEAFASTKLRIATMTRPMIDYDYDRSGAIRLRAEMVSGFLKRTRIGKRNGNKFAAVGAVLAAGTGVFWTTMLTSPPTT